MGNEICAFGNQWCDGPGGVYRACIGCQDVLRERARAGAEQDVAFGKFKKLVAQMRGAQKQYFAGRSHDVLLLAKELEREVDAFIAPPAPPSLFDGPGAV